MVRFLGAWVQDMTGAAHSSGRAGLRLGTAAPSMQQRHAAIRCSTTANQWS